MRLDVERDVHTISSLIYGLSGASEEIMDEIRPTLNSWGGNPSTRYNWKVGNAWNAGSDWEYRNGNYGAQGNASEAFVAEAQASGAKVRLAVPTLGWVAKNDDNNTCSFPLPGGGCGTANYANCQTGGDREIANPELANVRSDPESIKAWLTYLTVEKGYPVDFIALDNEPELWGYTHYDVHPDCTTYQEIVDKYLEYAGPIREAAPNARLVGPATCCWYFYWNSAAGRLDKLSHLNQDFLPWFLDRLRAADAKNGWRSLDVLDIHYYPEGLYNDQADPETAAWRLRSTRTLWDSAYSDESWIKEPVYLIPRMKKLLEQHYPGALLGISEWNWGADQTMNGALAIADVLGIFGRENLYYAAYWMFPPAQSPGAFAFRMYTNYDGDGSRFGDTSVWAESSNDSEVGSYAALDSTSGRLHVLLINKNPHAAAPVTVELGQFQAASNVEVYSYTQESLDRIVRSSLQVAGAQATVMLPPYSITHLIFSHAQ